MGSAYLPTWEFLEYLYMLFASKFVYFLEKNYQRVRCYSISRWLWDTYPPIIYWTWMDYVRHLSSMYITPYLYAFRPLFSLSLILPPRYLYRTLYTFQKYLMPSSLCTFDNNKIWLGLYATAWVGDFGTPTILSSMQLDQGYWYTIRAHNLIYWYIIHNILPQ